MNTKNGFVYRMREIRQELYGEDGLEALARTLGVPAQTWLNYERGVTMPAALLLKFLVLTSANVNWLLTGEGERLKPDIDPFRSWEGRESDLVGNW